MLAGLLRRLFLRRASPLAAPCLSRTAEAQFAGWVVLPQDLRAEPAKAPAAARDVEGLLSRFYESQEC
jgi:hypothetical protein